MKKFGIALFILALAAVALAATTGAILQVSNYTVVPSEVYAGTQGYLQVTITNQGDTEATAATVSYNLGGADFSDLVSDIPQGSSSQIVVPFRINPESAGSVQIVSAQVYYNSNTGASNDNKKTTISVPLRVAQIMPLDVSTVSLDRTLISPGEKVTATLLLANNGGVLNNVMITAQNGSEFSLDGKSQINVGTIKPNESRTVNVTLASSSSAAVGSYSIPLVITYQDALNSPVEVDVQVGPVSMLESSATYRITMAPQDGTEIGSVANFDLTVENTGPQPVSIVIDINSTDVFTPIGMQRLIFDNIPSHGNVTRTVSLGVASGKSAGYYTLPITMTPSVGKSSGENIGISVSATPAITLSVTSSGTTKQIQLTNTGNSEIRSVYATVSVGSGNRSAKTETFIGTLDVDDYATLESSFDGTSDATVSVTFKDSTNQQHTIVKTIGPSSGGTLSGGNFTGGFAGRLGNNTSRLPFGISLRAPDLASLALPAIGLIVLIAAAYFGYKKLYHGRKGSEKR
jgi:hypothetical protein